MIKDVDSQKVELNQTFRELPSLFYITHSLRLSVHFSSPALSLSQVVYVTSALGPLLFTGVISQSSSLVRSPLLHQWLPPLLSNLIYRVSMFAFNSIVKLMLEFLQQLNFGHAVLL